MMSQHCLNEDILMQMAQGKLPEPALSLSLIHLEGCDHCQSRFGEELVKAEKPFAVHSAQWVAEEKVPSELLKIPRIKFEADGIADDADALPPFFSHFTVISEINRGMDARVLEAIDPRLNRKVAIKVLDRQFAAEDPVLGRQFLEEARIIAQINHPSIVPIYDVGVYEEQPYIVMPLLSGENLRARLQRGAIEPLESIRLALQLLDGLKAAHEFGVIHKDLKPENLWLKPRPDGHDDLMILDFGNAQQVNTVAASATGTPLYIAPEQAMRQQVDARTDFFALGTVIYEMLTGRPAWSTDPEDNLAGPARDPRVPAYFTPVLERLLTLEPENRYADHETLKHDLARALQKYEKKRSLKKLALCTAAGLFGLLAAVSFYQSGSKPVTNQPALVKNDTKATPLPKTIAEKTSKPKVPSIKPLDRFQVQAGSTIASTTDGVILAKNATDGNFTLYDSRKAFKPIAILAETGKAEKAWINPGGKYVAILTDEESQRAPRVWRLPAEAANLPLQQTWQITLEKADNSDAAWMDRDGASWLYLTSNNRTVLEYKFPPEGNQPPAQTSLKHLYASITRLYPQPGGSLLIGAKDSGGVDIFDTRQHVIKHSWRMFPQGSPAIAWSPNPNFFAVSHADKEIRLFDISKEGSHQSFSGFSYLIGELFINFPQKVMDSVFITSNELIVQTAESNQYLYLYDIKTGLIRALIDIEAEKAEKIVALPDSRFATIGKSGMIRIYSTAAQQSAKP